nr:hypothetical protein [Candidatus Sigynarchaeota archaeon]
MKKDILYVAIAIAIVALVPSLLKEASASQNFNIIIDASGVSAQVRVDNNAYMPYGAIQTFSLVEGVHRLDRSGDGTFATFTVTATGTVTYDANYEGAVLTGSGSSRITVVGLPVTIDLTDVDMQCSVWGTNSGWFSRSSKLLYLINGLHIFCRGGVAATTTPQYNFTVELNGTVSYASFLDGKVFTGRGTTTLKFVGYQVTIDDIAVNTGVNLWGTSPWITNTTMNFKLMPSLGYPYIFARGGAAGAGVISYLNFTLALDGSVIISPYLNGSVFQKIGNATIKVIGRPIVIDTVGLQTSVYIFGTNTPYFSNTAKVVTLIASPGVPYFVQRGGYVGGGYVPYLNFTVEMDGTVNYSPSIEGVYMTGRGSSTIKIVGKTITLDGRNVSTSLTIWGMSVPGFSNTTINVTLLATPDIYYVFSQPGGNVLWSHNFTIKTDSTISYKPTIDNILLSGIGSSTVKMIAYPVVFDTRNLDVRVYLWGGVSTPYLTNTTYTFYAPISSYNRIYVGRGVTAYMPGYNFTIGFNGTVQYPSSIDGKLFSGLGTRSIKVLGRQVTVIESGVNQDIMVEGSTCPWFRGTTTMYLPVDTSSYKLKSRVSGLILGGDFLVNIDGSMSKKQVSHNNGTIYLLSKVDTTPPVITWNYTGAGTDSNPGSIIVSASDPSGLSIDPSGTYPVSAVPGTYTFTFTAVDADSSFPGSPLSTTINVSITIADDDTQQPAINWIYVGSNTVQDPGYISVTASDASGLVVDPSGVYNVIGTPGFHTYSFTAVDADNDRPGDSLSITINVTIGITGPGPFNITIDASGITPQLTLSGFPSQPIGSVRSYMLTIRSYTVSLFPGVSLPAISITAYGTISYTASLDNVVYRGLGTSRLEVIGYPILLDATNLSVTSFFSYTEPLTTGVGGTRTYYLPTGPNFAVSTFPGGSFPSNTSITVTATGMVSYAPGIDGIVYNGLGTSRLTIIGYPMTLDATCLSLTASIAYTEPLTTGTGGTRTYYLPTGVLFRASTFPGGIFPTSTAFMIKSNGRISYDPAIDGVVFNGIGTTRLIIIGYPMTLDATGLSLNSYIAYTDFWTGIGGTRLYYLPTGVPFRVATYPGGEFPTNTSFTMLSNGMVSYDPAIDSIVFHGVGTTILTIIGYPITLNATGLSVNSYIAGTEPMATGIGGTRIYYLPTSVLFRVGTTPGGYFPSNTSFRVTSSGKVSYDLVLDGLVFRGYGTTVLSFVGVLVLLDLSSSSASGTINGLLPYTTPGSVGLYFLPKIVLFNLLSYPGGSVPNSVFYINAAGILSKTQITYTYGIIRLLIETDFDAPRITWQYLGDGTDANPGIIVINASDASGLQVDPSGIYPVNPVPGTHVFTFTAVDADTHYPGDQLSNTISFNITIVDDDTAAPVITWWYTGDYTDANPGNIIINASDASGLLVDPSGVYSVSATPGSYTFIFTATDADNDRVDDSLSTTISFNITIMDDDTAAPVITWWYTGDYTDGNPGSIVVDASDVSGLLVDPSGVYPVNAAPGTCLFSFTAIEADDDGWTGDALDTTISFNITIVDDDNESPTIYGYYTGDFTDGNPGYVIVLANDSSGLTVDPSGIYPVANLIGLQQIFTFTAIDADDDRPGDQLETTVTFNVTLVDDDIDCPLINSVIYPATVYDNQSDFLVAINASDYSGINEIIISMPSVNYYATLASGIWYVSIPTPVVGNYWFTVIVFDADNDSLGDYLVTTGNYTFEVLQSSVIGSLELSIDVLGFALDYTHGIAVSFRVAANQVVDASYTVLIQLCTATFDALGTHSVKLVALGTYIIFASVMDQAGNHVNASMQFVIDTNIVRDLVLDEIATIEYMIAHAPANYWRNANNCNAMLNKVEELIALVTNCQFQEAYNKLLNDIKPKITGLTDNENGVVFGNGIFKNAWILDGSLRQEFEVHIDAVLWALHLLL